MYGSIKEPLVKIRFADLLWVYSKQKKISHAETVIQACQSLPINIDTWRKGNGDCWDRAISLAKQTRKEKSIKHIETTLMSAFEKSHPKDSLMQLYIAKLIYNKHLCIDERAFIATSILEQTKSFFSSGSLLKGQACFQLLRKMLNEQNRKEELSEALVLYGDGLVLSGNNKCSGDNPNHGLAYHSYHDAFSVYQKVPRVYKEKFHVYEKLEGTKEKIKESGIKYLDHMKVIRVESGDISETINKACQHVSGKENMY